MKKLLRKIKKKLEYFLALHLMYEEFEGLKGAKLEIGILSAEDEAPPQEEKPEYFLPLRLMYEEFEGLKETKLESFLQRTKLELFPI
ncbi:hypothetical protein E5676_scaffold313G002850 [Cucumis melo var. makuwa]|uniref:Uncharacterized protein n=1 Tax=Cucumis melo var. makuwa TaxID=1194695 RepID=A0A5D3DT39_CUCMM|nr:hypothetical protein E5676_scaffold313G002850 [Cucumis melo var. makuwa]